VPGHGWLIGFAAERTPPGRRLCGGAGLPWRRLRGGAGGFRQAAAARRRGSLL